MFSKFRFAGAFVLFTAAVAHADQAADASFQKIADEFLDGYFRARPLSGVSLGLHEFDGLVPDYSPAALAAERKRLHDFDSRFADFADRKEIGRAHV